MKSKPEKVAHIECVICNQTFWHNDEFDIHFEGSQFPKCKKYDNTFNDQNDLICHLKVVHIQTPNNDIICQPRANETKNENNLQEQLKSNHSDSHHLRKLKIPLKITNNFEITKKKTQSWGNICIYSLVILHRLTKETSVETTRGSVISNFPFI